MRTRGGRTEEVPLTAEAQELLGPRWGYEQGQAVPFIPRPADEPWATPYTAEVTYWALTDDSLF